MNSFRMEIYLFQNTVCDVSEEDSSGDPPDGMEAHETSGVLPDSEDDFYLMSGEAYNCDVAAMEVIPLGTLEGKEDRFDLLPVAAAPCVWTEARGTPCESFRVGEVPIHWMDTGNTKTSPMSDVDKSPKTVTRSMGTNTEEVTVLQGDTNELTVTLPRSTAVPSTSDVHLSATGGTDASTHPKATIEAETVMWDTGDLVEERMGDIPIDWG